MSTLAAAAGSVRQVAAWARVGTVLDVHAFATTTSEENAGLFRDAVRGALAAMRLAAQDREPQLVDVLRGVEVEADGSGVAVHARLPVDLLQQLSHEAHRHRHAEPAAESK